MTYYMYVVMSLGRYTASLHAKVAAVAQHDSLKEWVL
jgi:hypothetical protein